MVNVMSTFATGEEWAPPQRTKRMCRGAAPY
jgi:hypothetical protein